MYLIHYTEKSTQCVVVVPLFLLNGPLVTYMEQEYNLISSFDIVVIYFCDVKAESYFDFQLVLF